jgi:phosphomannomutase/phosphoglucomutase
MNKAIFRAYDIRGTADRDLDDDTCRAIGRAFGTWIARAPRADRAGDPDGPRTIAVGRDCRLSSDRMYAAAVDGVVSTGVGVVDVGVVPTPVLYFAPRHWRLDGHLMITGSHNPAGDNGFKLAVGTSSLHGDDISRLRAMIEQRGFIEAPASRRGAVEVRDVVTPYLQHARRSLSIGPRRLKLVLDAGNGAGGPTAVALYRSLGFELVELFTDMDGRFPNHHPDPTVEANIADLRRTVASESAEVGIALDGDADRVGAVDGKGRVIWGDQLMILFARDILAKKPGAIFIGEVKCSQALFDEIERLGGKAIMWKAGHSLIKAKMQEVGADLAGEMSGHLFFADRYPGFDDGIYAGARLLELLSGSDRSLAELYDSLPVMVNTPEMRIPCPDDIKFTVVERAAERLRRRPDVRAVIDVDGARAQFGDGWGLVRASNTGPLLVVRCEAQTAARLDEIRSIIEREIEAARASV